MTDELTLPTHAELDAWEVMATFGLESVRMWLLNSRLPGHEASAVEAAAVVGDASATILRLITAARAGLAAGEWLPIETTPKDKTPVLIAVPDQHRTKYIVGEAYFDPENYYGGDWWWAGTAWSDYHGAPISEINHWPPEFWRPLPAPPAIRNLPIKET